MIIQLSSSAVNCAMGTYGLKFALEDGEMELRIYSGTIPASANDAIGGATLLAVIRNGASGLTWESTLVNGQLTKNASETWSGVALATATATWGRFVTVADDGSAITDTTAVAFPRIQGDVSTVGAFINLDNPAMTSGAVQTINSARLFMPRQ